MPLRHSGGSQQSWRKRGSAPDFGTAKDGQTLTVNAGTWTGNTPIGFTFQWQRCDANGNGCQNIAGATAVRYKATSAEVAHRLRAVVTAKNAFGTTTAPTNATAVVVAAGPAGAIKLPGGGTSIPITSVALPDRLVADRVSFMPTAIHAVNERITARIHVVDSNGYVVRDALVYAAGVPANRVTVAGEAKTDQTGWATLVYTPLRGLPFKRGARLDAVRPSPQARRERAWRGLDAAARIPRRPSVPVGAVVNGLGAPGDDAPNPFTASENRILI